MRRGRLIDINDPIYMLDKNRGVCYIPTTIGSPLKITSLKHKSGDAYDEHYAEFEIKGLKFRVQLDELTEAIKYA